MAVSFVRQLGAESGVQLNPLRDNSEVPAFGNDDQVFGIMMRATRGRIDRPFLVDRSNVYRKLGKGETIKKNALNTAWVHVVEALNKGAYRAVVQRMVSSQAKIKWALVKTIEETSTFAVEDEEPDSDFSIAVKHLDCHNDGIRLSIHADKEVNSGNTPVETKIVYLRIISSDNDLLAEFRGSLDPDAKDDYGQSFYLPNVVSSMTDAFEVIVHQDASVPPNADCYGNNATGQEKWATSNVLIAFDEGSTTYTTENITAFRDKLQNTPYDYAYISSGGSQDISLIPQLALLAHDTNRQLRIDIPGHLTPEQAITWLNQFNLGSNPSSHLMHAFWSPLKSDDPTGVNGSGYYGVATMNIAYACARNAQKNAKGFAPKNYPIAGREHGIQRTRVVQTYMPTKFELNDLAKAKINPCIYETYSGGGKYVFRDSLTCAQVETSLRKLISVADMSSSIDEAVTRAGKDLLQLPMMEAIKRMKDYLQNLFEGAQASGWLVDSPHLDDKAFIYNVQPNEMRPNDVMDVQYWLRYDGVARQIMVTQTISR